MRYITIIKTRIGCQYEAFTKKILLAIVFVSMFNFTIEKFSAPNFPLDNFLTSILLHTTRNIDDSMENILNFMVQISMIKFKRRYALFSNFIIGTQ